MTGTEEKKHLRSKWLDLLMAATIGLFLVTCITGIMMLCGIGKGIVKGPHEWLGVGFVAAGLIHGIRHSAFIVRYAKSATFWVSAAVVLVLTAAFVLPSLNLVGRGPGGRGDDPMRQIMQTLQEAPLASLAGMVKKSPDALTAKLRNAGATVMGPEQTISEIAKNSKRESPELMAVVFSQRTDD